MNLENVLELVGVDMDNLIYKINNLVKENKDIDYMESIKKMRELLGTLENARTEIQKVIDLLNKGE